jgi:hypothetical protein
MVTDARGQIGQAIHLEDTASKGRSGRVIPMNEELRTDQHLLDPERKVEGDVAASYRELVLAMVPARRVRRLFESQRPTHFHHQYGEEDLDRGRVPPGRPDVGRAYEPSDDAAVHRSQPGSAGPDCGTRLTDGASEPLNEVRSRGANGHCPNFGLWTQLRHQACSHRAGHQPEDRQGARHRYPRAAARRAAACSLDGLRPQPHDAWSAFTGRVN